MPESIHSIVRQAEQNYVSGNTTLGKYVNWSMHDTVERIFAYLNSKHISGDKDSMGRDKPFFNIVSAAVNIWYRATDIDRKDIRFIPTSQKSVVLAFIANVMLQNWMTEARFGVFLNQWGRTLAQYGSAVRKFVEKDGQLIPSVIPWNRIIPDPVQYDALPRIEKFYKTPAQLKNMATPGHPSYAGYDMKVVNSLVTAVASRKTVEGQQKDNMADFIEIFEVHGNLDARLLEDNPKNQSDDEPVDYVQQMHVVSYVSGKEDGEDQDFTLFKGKEKMDVYGIDHLIEEDGRTLAIGAVEYLFDAQWMQNHSIKAWKDNMDLTSKIVMQTSDSHFIGRNVLQSIENGDILIHQKDMPLNRVPIDEYDITNIKSFAEEWRVLGQELTSTPEAARGVTPPSGTALGTVQIVTSQGLSLFELMTENKGLAIEDMMRTYVIPFLKKKLKNKDEVVAILDDAGIEEIDSMYVPAEAVKRFNQRTLDQIQMSLQQPLNAPIQPQNIPQPFNPQAEQQGVKQDMAPMGNKRFFKPDELDKKTWDDLFSDFEWDSIRVEVTNEQMDKQVILQTLSSVLQTIATNPAILQDPNAKMLFGRILSETGAISPLQLTSSANSAAAPLPVPSLSQPAPTPSPLSALQ